MRNKKREGEKKGIEIEKTKFGWLKFCLKYNNFWSRESKTWNKVLYRIPCLSKNH